MNLLKKLRTFAVLAFFLSFLASATLTSCGNQSQADDKESTEHPAEEKAEHPEEKTDEHPAESDSTKTEQQ